VYHVNPNLAFALIFSSRAGTLDEGMLPDLEAHGGTIAELAALTTDAVYTRWHVDRGI
jgi:hypothetical protein